jgi:NADH-quinone oxidoreductase subunit M
MQGAVYQMLAHGISTGGLFLLAGMLYDRRHTYEIVQYGGLSTPVPHLAAFFLFVVLSSLGLPMLNGFVGEFLILLGTYQTHWNWAAWAALGVILSACYLLWFYQRVFYGDVTVEKNRTLPDLSARERTILAATAVIILWMGIGSSSITSRTENASQLVIDQSKVPPRAYEVLAPAAKPPAPQTEKAANKAPAAANSSTTQISLERLGTR